MRRLQRKSKSGTGTLVKAFPTAPAPRDRSPDRTGIAWYGEAEYPRLLELALDRETMHDTYAEWLQGAEALLARLRGKAVRVPLKLDELEAWCRERGQPFDGAARSRYVAELVQRRS